MKSFLKRAEKKTETVTRIASGRELAGHLMEKAAVKLYDGSQADRAVTAALSGMPCAVQTVANSRSIAALQRSVELRSPLIWLLRDATFSDIILPPQARAAVFYASAVEEYRDMLLLALALQKTNMPVVVVCDAATVYDAPATVGWPQDAWISAISETESESRQLLDITRAAAVGQKDDDWRRLRRQNARHSMLFDTLHETIEQAAEKVKQLTGKDIRALTVNGGGATAIASCKFIPATKAQQKKSAFLTVNRWYPFPQSQLAEQLQGFKAVAVLEEAGSDAFRQKAHGCLVHSKKQPAWANGFYVPAMLDENGSAAIIARLKTMEPGSRDEFYLTPHTPSDLRLYPLAEAARQWLQRYYPQALRRMLPAESAQADTEKDVLKIDCYLPAYLHWEKAIALFAQTLNGLKTGAVRSRLWRLDSAMLPSILFRLEIDKPAQGNNTSGRIVLCHGNTLSGMIPVRADDRAWLFSGDFDDETLWHSLNDHQRKTLAGQKTALLRADATTMLSEIMLPGQRPYLEPLLAICAWQIQNGWLMGDPEKNSAWSKAVNRIYGANRKEVFALIRRAEEALHELPVSTLPAFETLTRFEDTAPWNFNGDDALQTRFWESEGYFYQKGRPDIPLPAEHDTSAALASGTAAMRDYFSGRRNHPALIPENCTACGQCWARCPDSALPAALFSTADLLDAMFKRASQKNTFLHLPRLQKQWAQLMHKAIKNDGLNAYRHSGPLLKDSFETLLEKLAPDEDKKLAMLDEYGKATGGWTEMPLVKSERWFDGPENETKGSGRLMTITLNPNACKECLACIDACPDNALESVVQGENERTLLKQRFSNTLELAPYGSDADDTLFRMQRPESYFTLSGGDNALPGSGGKSALHLLLAGMARKGIKKREQLENEVGALLKKLDDLIAGNVQQTLKINELDEFARRLAGLQKGELSSEKLRELADNPPPDEERLKKLAELRNRLGEWHKRLLPQGDDGHVLAPFTMVLAAGTNLHWAAKYPYNPFNVPWLLAGDDPAADLRGMQDATNRQMGQLYALMQQAEDALQDIFDEQDDAPLPPVKWTDKQKSLAPPALLVCERSTLDRISSAGLQALFGKGQSATLALIDDLNGSGGDALVSMALQSKAQLVQATAAYPEHLLESIGKLDTLQPAVLRLYACEPLQLGLPSYAARQIEEKAVRSRVFPLIHFDGTELNLKANPDPEKTFSGPDDKAFGPGQWALYHFGPQHFRQPTAADSDGLTLLEDYLSRQPDKRGGLIAAVTVQEDGKRQTWIVDDDVIALSENAAARWQALQETAGIRDRTLPFWQEKWNKEKEEALARQKSDLEESWQQKLNTLDQQHFEVYHKRLSERLAKIYQNQGGAPAAENLAQWLRQQEENGQGND